MDKEQVKEKMLRLLRIRWPLTFEQRFWNGVDKSGGPDACWPWLKSKYANGYGQFSESGQKKLYAHRVTWTFTHGRIPDGFCVLHRCDRRDCCNPAHMFLGTQYDNVHDMIKKGRQARGESLSNKGEEHGMAKLTKDQIIEIRFRHFCGETFRSLAKDFAIGPTTVGHIIHRRSWKHL